MESLFDLSGKGIVVSGGGGWLGASLSLGIASAGATVVMCGRRAEPLAAVTAEAEARKLRGRVVAEVADVGREDDMERVLDRAMKEIGSVHGLVNNACSPAPGRLLEVSRASVQQTLDSVVADTILATQAAARRMRKHGGGSILNIASMYGLVSPQPASYRDAPDLHNPPAYGAGKAGVIQFSRYAACELADDGIRVNSLSPGAFPPPEVRERREFTAELIARIPLGRIAEPSELVGPAVFLLSPAASYVTGHNLVVDGGWTAW